MAQQAPLASQAVDPDRPPLTPQKTLAHVIHADARLRGRDGRVVEQNFVWFCHLLQPSCRGHGIAGESHRLRPGHFPKSGHDLARCDADPQLHGLLVSARVACQRGLHLERAQATSQRVVVVSSRHAEDGEHRVAYELLERPAEIDDRLAEYGQRTVDARPHFLGIKLVDETRVSDEIGKQGGHDPAIADLQAVRQPRPGGGRTDDRSARLEPSELRNRDRASGPLRDVRMVRTPRDPETAARRR